jgi:NAD(P)-dependent dehydrogenase (short-subunit alcohol dehydrogenase family)
MNPIRATGRLANRIALISGGAQGIGRGMATLFQREGACVFILDCDAESGTQFLQANLQEPLEIQQAVETLRKSHEHLDILVNNAGVEIEKSLAKLTQQDWDRVLEVNLRGAFLLTQAVAPWFPESGGAIVNISSIHASHAFPDSIPYACSKAGMVALTRNLALELAPRHIRVNAICPGYIDTRLWEEYLRNSPDPTALAAQTTALHPLGRRGMPADVSEAALFLASEASAFITGIDLVVDGGLTVRAHP